MSLPNQVLTAIVTRFDTLIAEGAEILRSAETVPAEYNYNSISGRHHESRAAFKKMDWSRYVEWRTKTSTLLCYLLPKGNVHRGSAETFPELTPTETHMEWALSFIRAVKNDLQSGFLNLLSSQIEAEIAADYMGQAERLLKEGQSGKFDHVPAAVLSGAVLEKALRQLCAQQQPPISVTTTTGDSKTLNPLIDDLKRAGQFNELKAKQLRARADIRNKAAHGEFDQFKREDVDQMLKGITTFLAEHIT